MSAARMLPSSSNAIRARPSTCRACPADIRFSRRSSIHFSANGHLARGQHDAHVFAHGTTFWPKPPPVSRMMTRTWCAGMPSSRAANARSSCGIWVDAQTVSSSEDASHSTTMPRVSIGTGA